MMLGREFIITTIVFFAFMLNDAAEGKFYHSDYVAWNASRICNSDYKFNRDDICKLFVSSSSTESCSEMNVELYNDQGKKQIYRVTILACRKNDDTLRGCVSAGENKNGIIVFSSTKFKINNNQEEKCYSPGSEKVKKTDSTSDEESDEDSDEETD